MKSKKIAVGLCVLALLLALFQVGMRGSIALGGYGISVVRHGQEHFG